MRFTMNAGEFKPAIKAAAKIATAADTREMASVLFDAGGDGLSVCATDGDRSLEMRTLALVEEPGAALLPAARLDKVAKLLPDMPVTIESSGRSAVLSFGKTSMELAALDPMDFPGVRKVEGAALEIAPEDFELVAKVAACASKDTTRGVIQSVRFECSDGSLTVAATDAYALASATVPYAGDGFDGEVPAALFPLVDPDGPVRISYGGNAASASSGAAMHSIRCNVGTYPRWRALMRDAGTCAEVDVKALESAMKRASIVSKYADFEVADGSMRISAHDDTGRVIDELELLDMPGGAMRFTLNTEVLAKALAPMEGPSCTLLQSDSPVYLSDGRARSLAMTMRR